MILIFDEEWKQYKTNAELLQAEVEAYIEREMKRYYEEQETYIESVRRRYLR